VDVRERVQERRKETNLGIFRRGIKVVDKEDVCPPVLTTVLNNVFVLKPKGTIAEDGGKLSEEEEDKEIERINAPETMKVVQEPVDVFLFFELLVRKEGEKKTAEKEECIDRKDRRRDGLQPKPFQQLIAHIKHIFC